VTTCAFCSKQEDEAKPPLIVAPGVLHPLATWEQLTVTATRNGGSEHILSVMVCPTCAPAPGKITLAPAKAPTAAK
jgi:hypothetical protein